MKVLRTVVAGIFTAAAGVDGMSSRLAAQTDRVVHEAVVTASLDQVWTAFTTATGLEAWMVPHADIDLRVGGRMRTNFNALEPKHMLSFKVSRAPAGFPFPNAVKSMWTVVYFDALGPGKTRVREISLGFEDNEESRRMREFFEKSDAQLLSALQKHFAAERPK
jgi:uncharacterized protein YndB with AHSA1/START domain